MSTDDHSLLGPWLLNAVDVEDRRRFDAHLTVCESCQEDVASLRRTPSRLAGLTPDLPPPELRERVLAAAGRTPQDPPEVATVSPLAPDRSRRRLAVLAAAAAIVLGATLTWQVVRDDAPSGEMTATEVLADDAVDVHRMETEAGMVDVGMSHEMHVVAVDGSDLHQPEGMGYQLWWRDADGAESAGMLGDDMVIVLPAEDAMLMMTLEPAAGSRKPSKTMMFEVATADL